MKLLALGCPAHAPLLRPVNLHFRKLASNSQHISASCGSSSHSGRLEQQNSKQHSTGSKYNSYEQLRAARYDRTRCKVACFAHSRAGSFDSEFGKPLQGQSEVSQNCEIACLHIAMMDRLAYYCMSVVGTDLCKSPLDLEGVHIGEHWQKVKCRRGLVVWPLSDHC